MTYNGNLVLFSILSPQILVPPFKFQIMNSKFSITIILILFAGVLFAQPPRGKRPGGRGGERPGIEVKGKVVEAAGNQPIEFATVMIADPKTGEAITGATTDMDGNFSVRTKARKFYIEVSFIGFNSEEIKEVGITKGIADLGTIVLKEDKATLDEVVVRAEKSTTEFKLDKRVFNVGKDLSSTGASALEVLNNVPSVNVNIEGEISLRGSTGVQILINGKPSVIASEQGNALGTITADMIQQVEVITNPSAKYDAEGTSGIINIVIKKEERKGINGSVTLNTGIPQNHSIGLSVNRRTEKFNLFSQLGVGYKELPRENENINRDFKTNTEIISSGTEYRNEVFYRFVLGADYHINKNNVLTLSGNLNYEVEKQPSRTDFTSSEISGAKISEWYREEVTEATNPKYQYELQYKRDFKDHKNHDLIFSAIGNLFAKDQSSEFFNTVTFGTKNFNNQLTATQFNERKSTFKLDYTRPFSKKYILETGAQYLINDVGNNFEVTDWDNGEWVVNQGQTNNFEYVQNVLGVYGTGAYEGDIWGVKLGLRVENTDLNTLLTNTDESNSQNFTDYFPTLHTSYKLTEAFSLQAGYSKRIYRPRLWDLNPFFNIRNNFNIRAGNPDLLPEYTDSYEVGAIYIIGKTSLNFSVYQRNTTDVIDRVFVFDNNVSTAKPFNIGTRESTGLEVNGKFTLSKKITLMGDFNYNFFKRDGELEGRIFDFNADQWSSKVTGKFKLPAKIDFEITGRYQSREQTVQGIVSDQLSADFGLRKKILKGRGIFNLSVRDVFASRIRESEITQPDFYTYGRGLRGRFVTFGFSYGFGKGEAMEFSGRGRRR